MGFRNLKKKITPRTSTRAWESVIPVFRARRKNANPKFPFFGFVPKNSQKANPTRDKRTQDSSLENQPKKISESDRLWLDKIVMRWFWLDINISCESWRARLEMAGNQQEWRGTPWKSLDYGGLLCNKTSWFFLSFTNLLRRDHASSSSCNWSNSKFCPSGRIRHRTAKTEREIGHFQVGCESKT